MNNAKSFFHHWCSKKGVAPRYECRSTGPQNRLHFLCECRVDGYAYVGAGNSSSKKDAEKNAAKDFLQYLVRQKIVNERDVPKGCLEEDVGGQDGGGGGEEVPLPWVPAPHVVLGLNARPVFQPGQGPNTIGSANTPLQREGHKPTTDHDIIADQKRVEEVEDVDMNAAIHGNSTVENAKSKLQFMDANKIKSEYTYQMIGPDNARLLGSKMEKEPSGNTSFPAFCHWDVDKYKSKYPAEHWNLCKLFILTHKTKYPENHLIHLTDAFFNMGVYGRCSDPKTDRMVAALCVPVLEHFLGNHQGAVRHPFMQEDVSIGSTQEINIASASTSTKPSTATEVRQHQSQGARSAGQKQESRNSLENRAYSLEGSNPSNSSSLPSEKQQTFSTRKRVSSDLKIGFDKDQIPQKRDKTEVSSPSDNRYRLKKMMSWPEMKRLLKGLVIIRDVTKDSTISNEIVVLEDSFKRSKFGPCTWEIEIIDVIKDIVRIKLLWGNRMLVEAEGQKKEYVHYEIAKAFLYRLSSFTPIIQAKHSYFKDGTCRNLPDETPKGPCRHYFGEYSFSLIKNMIENFAQKREFLEMIVLHHPDKPNEFSIEEVTEFIDKERSDKLMYRLANFEHRGRQYRAICIWYRHNGWELWCRLQDHADIRYSTAFKESNMSPSNSSQVAHQKTSSTISGEEKRDDRKKIQNSFNRNRSGHFPSSMKNASQVNKNGSTESLKGSSVNHEESNIRNPTAEGMHFVSSDKSGSSRSLGPSLSKDSTVTPSTSKPLLGIPPSVNVGRKSEGLQWMPKEHLSVLAKSIYLVKFVKEDSTTEDDPFNLLKSTCSLIFNIEFVYVMKCFEDKNWMTTVVMKYDQGNILVGEAKASSCAEARKAAAQDAVNSILTYCRVVEPNFKYFAEGGVPRFISLKSPIKTSTYEIMVLDTVKNPLTQQVVNLLLQMFVEDSSPEDLFFLASDYTREERERICKTAGQFGLVFRLFGQRNRASSADDAVSTQHVCVYQPKSVSEVVQQLIVSGGSTEKYSIVTKPNTTGPKEDVSPSPTSIELTEVCDQERLCGGCVDPKCSLTHINILDSVVNQYLGIRV